jgi:hypothetical protein
MQLMTPVVFALAALGAGPEGLPEPVPMVATQVRVLEMKDLSWRTAAHAKLTPVARRDGATVWTAPAGALPGLAKDALNLVEAPKVTAVAGQSAQIQTKQVRTFVAGMKLIGDTKVDGGIARTTYAPEVDRATDGCVFEVSARAIDQGTLAKIDLKSSRIGTIHQVKVLDPRGEDAPHRLNAVYQVPEMIEERVAGEWVIPKDGLLVIGLGPRTVTGKDGQTAVTERVVVVQAKPVSGPIAMVPAASVVGREVVYASPAFAAPMPPPAVAASKCPVQAEEVADADRVGPKHNGHITVHGVYVLAALPWRALPGPMGIAAQAHILGIGGPVLRKGWPGDADVMVTRTGAEAAVEPPAAASMPRVPSRHLPGTVTPDGTRAVLPPLPDHRPDPASYDPSAEPRPTPQTTTHLEAQNVRIHGKVVIRGADGVELIADGLTIRTLPKGDAAVKPASATLPPPAIRANEPVTPPCCESAGSDRSKAGWSKPKDPAAPTVASGAAPLKLQLPNSGGKVELEIHAVPAP